MMFLGIDPGITGGIAILDSGGRLLLAESMPVMPAPQAGKRWVDPSALARLIRGVAGPHIRVYGAIEHVGAMPSQGVVSVFSFGQTFGTLLGTLGAMSIGYELVRPQAWKKYHGISADKSAALGLCARRWPSLNLRKTDDGIAEAILIADWQRARQFQKEHEHV